MSEKVRVTQEQAEAIELAVSLSKPEQIVEEHIRYHLRNDEWQYGKLRTLNDISPRTLISALYTGYEVEPEFKEKDWVVLKNGKVAQIIFIEDERPRFSNNTVGNPKGKVFAYDVGGDYWYDYEEIERHATPEEIKQVKERRMDEKLDNILSDLSRDEMMYLYEKIYETVGDWM